jgi:hypothetical protein
MPADATATMKHFARRVAAIVRAPLLRAAHATVRRPVLRRCASAVLDTFPSLRAALRRVLRGPGWQLARTPHVPQTRDDLSPETLAAYRALQAAFAKRPD